MRLWSGLRPDACGERNCDTVVRQRHILLSVSDKRATPLESRSSNSWHRGQDAGTLRHHSHVDFSEAKGSRHLSLFLLHNILSFLSLSRYYSGMWVICTAYAPNKICFSNIMFTKHNNIENFQHNIGIMLQKHYVCRA